MTRVGSPDQDALTPLVIRSDVPHHPLTRGHSFRKYGGIGALMINVQNRWGPDDVGKKRGCRTGNLLMPSPPDRRHRFNPGLLLDLPEFFSHQIQGFVPREAFPLPFTSPAHPF